MEEVSEANRNDQQDCSRCESTGCYCAKDQCRRDEKKLSLCYDRYDEERIIPGSTVGDFIIMEDLKGNGIRRDYMDAAPGYKEMLDKLYLINQI